MGTPICPRCGSDKIVAGKEGFNVLNALLWKQMTGSNFWGFMGGSARSNVLKVHCLNCSAEFSPSEVVMRPELHEEVTNPDSVDGLGTATCQYCKKFMVIGNTCISCKRIQYKKKDDNSEALLGCVALLILLFLFTAFMCDVYNQIFN